VFRNNKKAFGYFSKEVTGRGSCGPGWTQMGSTGSAGTSVTGVITGNVGVAEDFGSGGMGVARKGKADVLQANAENTSNVITLRL
jgi:hypothetical protein